MRVFPCQATTNLKILGTYRVEQILKIGQKKLESKTAQISALNQHILVMVQSQLFRSKWPMPKKKREAEEEENEEDEKKLAKGGNKGGGKGLISRREKRGETQSKPNSSPLNHSPLMKGSKSLPSYKGKEIQLGQVTG